MHRLSVLQDLQKATASEPLTLDAEYSMQQSWRLDGDKLTFIVCSPPSRLPVPSLQSNVSAILGKKDDADDRMIGDVNLFLSEDEDGDDDAHDANEDNAGRGNVNVVGEIEIMIARTNLQGQGYGRAALTAFFWYIMTNISGILSEYAASLPTERKGAPTLKYLRVKIDAANERSIRLFEKVGFKKISETPNYFGELELRWNVSQFKRDQEVPRTVVYKLNPHGTSGNEK
jgi:RimJ/RimL family protein N-acetyltransferase